ncbi:MAG: N-acetyltransferase [Candidatus Omnitrophica bacterium]|nr:N-acetyltransferase [Candidatus Omnitrophota bacterium]
MKVRKADLKDVYQIKNLININANKGLMLPVSVNQLYERIRDFWVIIDDKNKVIGCGALKIIWKDLGEIRSLAIKNNLRQKGHGRLLVDRLMEEAKSIGLKKVFVLTYAPEFFEKFSFYRTEKSKLPHKIWMDCINCPKFPRCDETSLLKIL